MNDAEYSKKLDKAKRIQKAIKKKLKGKEAGLSDSAKKFSEVKDDLVTFVTAQKVQNRLNPWLINLAESAEITRNLPD